MSASELLDCDYSIQYHLPLVEATAGRPGLADCSTIPDCTNSDTWRAAQRLVTDKEQVTVAVTILIFVTVGLGTAAVNPPPIPKAKVRSSSAHKRFGE